MRFVGSAVAVAALLLGGAFAACASSPPTPPPPATGGEGPAPAARETTAPEPATSGGAPALSATAAAAAAKTAPPTTVEDCKSMKPEEIRAELTNEPDGGTCMNNAMTSADAGSSDRCFGVVDAIRSHRDAFRCCYDLYARAHQSPRAHVVLHVELAPDGKVESASLNEQRSSLSSPEIESCMASIAATLSFPRSPSGRETKFNYPFDFEPKR